VFDSWERPLIALLVILAVLSVVQFLAAAR
jgi:hypothetical protein